MKKKLEKNLLKAPKKSQKKENKKAPKNPKYSLNKAPKFPKKSCKKSPKISFFASGFVPRGPRPGLGSGASSGGIWGFL